MVFGHFAVADFQKINTDQIILVFRDPVERAVSQFKYVRDRLPNTPVKQRHHQEIDAIKNGTMDFEAFCQLPQISHFYEHYYLRNLPKNKEILAFSFDQMPRLCAYVGDFLGIPVSSNVRLNTTELQPAITGSQQFFAQNTTYMVDMLARYGAR